MDAANLQITEDASLLPVAVALQNPAEVGAVTVPLAGVATEAERLEVGDVIGTTVVLRDDVINLQRRLERLRVGVAVLGLLGQRLGLSGRTTVTRGRMGSMLAA